MADENVAEIILRLKTQGDTSGMEAMLTKARDRLKEIGDSSKMTHEMQKEWTALHVAIQGATGELAKFHDGSVAAIRDITSLKAAVAQSQNSSPLWNTGAGTATSMGLGMWGGSPPPVIPGGGGGGPPIVPPIPSATIASFQQLRASLFALSQGAQTLGVNLGPLPYLARLAFDPTILGIGGYVMALKLINDGMESVAKNTEKQIEISRQLENERQNNYAASASATKDADAAYELRLAHQLDGERALDAAMRNRISLYGQEEQAIKKMLSDTLALLQAQLDYAKATGKITATEADDTMRKAKIEQEKRDHAAKVEKQKKTIEQLEIQEEYTREKFESDKGFPEQQRQTPEYKAAQKAKSDAEAQLKSTTGLLPEIKENKEDKEKLETKFQNALDILNSGMANPIAFGSNMAFLQQQAVALAASGHGMDAAKLQGQLLLKNTPGTGNTQISMPASVKSEADFARSQLETITTNLRTQEETVKEMTRRFNAIDAVVKKEEEANEALHSEHNKLVREISHLRSNIEIENKAWVAHIKKEEAEAVIAGNTTRIARLKELEGKGTLTGKESDELRDLRLRVGAQQDTEFGAARAGVIPRERADKRLTRQTEEAARERALLGPGGEASEAARIAEVAKRMGDIHNPAVLQAVEAAYQKVLGVLDAAAEATSQVNATAKAQAEQFKSQLEEYDRLFRGITANAKFNTAGGATQ